LKPPGLGERGSSASGSQRRTDALGNRNDFGITPAIWRAFPFTSSVLPTTARSAPNRVRHNPSLMMTALGGVGQVLGVGEVRPSSGATSSVGMMLAVIQAAASRCGSLAPP
jgi:hypothetical protein